MALDDRDAFCHGYAPGESVPMRNLTIRRAP
jgi:hypothetical protein